MIARAFEAGWSGAITKVLGLKQRQNPRPRLAAHFFSGKAVGLENIESVIYPIESWLPKIRELKRKYPDKILGINLMAEADITTWQEMARQVQDCADLLELNLSCPLTEKGGAIGATIGQDPHLTYEIVRGVKEVADIPVMVKLTPNVTDIVSVAKAAEKGGADAISAINTVACLVGIDLEKMEPMPSVNGASAFGGYSGPAIKPIALGCIARLAKNTKLPISGIGGITTWYDAVEFLMVGASTLQLCTAVMFKGYKIIDHLRSGLSNYLISKGFESVKDIIGYILPKIKDIGELDFSYRAVSLIDRSKCTRCGLCYVACRDGGYDAIKLDEKKSPVVDEKKCDGCFLCAQVCPAGAVKLKSIP
jgi:dihydropyrimidine dehydrogenase (NAD+) subunit PreA